MALRKAIRELDRRLTTAWLVLLAGGVIAVSLLWGWKAGGLAFLAAMLFLGGFDCLWSILWHPHRTRIEDGIEKAEQASHARSTEDNPTIR